MDGATVEEALSNIGREGKALLHLPRAHLEYCCFSLGYLVMRACRDFGHAKAVRRLVKKSGGKEFSRAGGTGVLIS